MDKYDVYLSAIKDLQESGTLPKEAKHRPLMYLNNLLEQEHRFVQPKVRAELGFQDFWTAKRTIRGYETMNVIRKRRIAGVEKGDIRSQNHFISKIFGIAA